MWLLLHASLDNYRLGKQLNRSPDTRASQCHALLSNLSSLCHTILVYLSMYLYIYMSQKVLQFDSNIKLQ